MPKDKSQITTIVVKKSTVERLCSVKEHERETMEQVITRLVESYIAARQ